MVTQQSKDDFLKPMRDDAQQLMNALSPRQLEVLALKSRTPTPSNKEIGRLVKGEAISASMVEKHLTRAKEKMGESTIDDAIVRFNMARALVGDPTWGPGDLELVENLVKKAIRDLPEDRTDQVLDSPEFKIFLRDLRSTGPRAWDAKFGRGWRIIAGLLIVLLILVTMGAAFSLAGVLDEQFAPMPSQP